MDLVKLTNTGDTVQVLTKDGKVQHKLLPADSKIVRWEEAVSWFGDPTYDEERERLHMYKLLQLFWKYQDGIDTPDTWAEKIPTIEVHTLEGDQIWMLLFDPEREHEMPGLGGLGDHADSSDINILRAQNAELKAQMDKISAMLEGLTTTRQEELNPAELTALATVESGSAASASELPKAVPTAANASDAPQTTRTRQRVS